MAGVAAARGVSFRYNSEIREIAVGPRGVSGVVLSSGEPIAADAVVVNADSAAVAAGLLGAAARRALPRQAATPVRSLSAVTWSTYARAEGFPLDRHTVFFSGDYHAEFDDIRRHGRPPYDPTVYICAQDRGIGAPPDGMPERLLVLTNAPAANLSEQEIEQCQERTHRRLAQCGLRIDPGLWSGIRTTPASFGRLFPGTSGALYGPATHGWRASFARPTARTRIPGLYLAGGSVHPGPGVPMAALSGTMAADAVLADRASTVRSRMVATPGGMSTRSATTGVTP
jgi:1-hydroxycarotenoid 3,4-desaturase